MALPRTAWKKGQNPNPGGRPGRLRGKGMVEFIAKQTRDGMELAEYFLRVLRGHEKGATPAHKQAAAEWLANRFMGKAVDISLNGDLADENNPLAELPNAELRALILAATGEPNAHHQKSEGASDTREPRAAPAAPLADALSDAPAPRPEAASTAPMAPLPPNPKPYSEAPRCPACGLRRAHNLDCPERPKA